MKDSQASTWSSHRAEAQALDSVSVDLTQRVATTRQALTQDKTWDLVVIGAGITGAGIARLAAQRGWQVLLLERGDWASGTSSLSSKMVHGGLRYLAQGHLGLTYQALRARERLLNRWPDLVYPQRHALVHYAEQPPGPWLAHLGTWAYFLLSGAAWHHRPRFCNSEALQSAQAHLPLPSNRGASLYFDAMCDDSQLVLRTLAEATAMGAHLSHYTEVTGLLKDQDRCTGVAIQGQHGTRAIRARGVVNATGAWADSLCALPEGYQLRPQRGSHLMFRQADLPLDLSLTLRHPEDGRVVFCYPWAGATVLGTTDLDHMADPRLPVQMSAEEQRYLLALLPTLGIAKPPPIHACWAGLRPILVNDEAPGNPSDHSREHLIWIRPGLVNVTGGKLTTFEAMAEDALSDGHLAAAGIPLSSDEGEARPLPRVQPVPSGGQPLGDSSVSASTLAYWARLGAVEQLSDLLLRRTRLGWLLGEELVHYQDAIEVQCDSLAWSAEQWQHQWHAYWQQWRLLHRPH